MCARWTKANRAYFKIWKFNTATSLIHNTDLSLSQLAPHSPADSYRDDAGVWVMISPCETHDQLCGTDREPHKHSPYGADPHITFRDSISRCEDFQSVDTNASAFYLLWARMERLFSAIAWIYWMRKQSQHVDLSVLLKNTIYISKHTHKHIYAIETASGWTPGVLPHESRCVCVFVQYCSIPQE